MSLVYSCLMPLMQDLMVALTYEVMQWLHKIFNESFFYQI